MFTSGLKFILYKFVQTLKFRCIMLRIIFLFSLLIATSQTCLSQNTDSIVSATVQKAETFRKSGNWDDAIQILKKLLSELDKEETSMDIALAPLYHKLGVNYYYKGELFKAEQYATRALEIRVKFYDGLHIDIARGYFARGAIFRTIQDYINAKQDMKLAISTMEHLLSQNISQDTSRLYRMYEEYIRLRE